MKILYIISSGTALVGIAWALIQIALISRKISKGFREIEKNRNDWRLP